MPIAAQTESARQKSAARAFVDRWQGRGNEKQDTQKFWNDLLNNVLGVSDTFSFIDYEKPIKVIKTIGRHRDDQLELDFNFGFYTEKRSKTTKFADAWIPSTKVLIEQKSINVDLLSPIKQSDGQLINAVEQAELYAQNIRPESPDFLIVSNFKRFFILDRRSELFGDIKAAVVIDLEELPEQIQLMQFIVKEHLERIVKQQQVSIEAARLLGSLRPDIENEHIKAVGKDGDYRYHLAVLMVRLLYCLYAEDSGLFNRAQFYNYLLHKEPGAGSFRHALSDLFKVLNTPEDERDPYLSDELKAFPYINGGLFKEEIRIPIMTPGIKYKLLQDCSTKFNWSSISPTIFGSLFESILSGEAQRAGGIHYTSPENIHKVIDPLFLDEIIDAVQSKRNDKKALLALQRKISSLTFLDPACGSGNFLTETYKELRRVENKILGIIRDLEGVFEGQVAVELEEGSEKVLVNIGQFYGIEINDFAVCVANTALCIAEHQANLETEKILDRDIRHLPLKDNKNIICANALTIDWNDLLPAEKCSYILGNPPFVGYSNHSEDQKKERRSIFGDAGGVLDYVACWYKKAADYISNHSITVAFVSTSSICQGQQVEPLWKPIISSGIQIVFAHRSFVWESEAADIANVHVVIIGFTRKTSTIKLLFDKNCGREVNNINAYLIDAPNVFIQRRAEPISAVLSMVRGCGPTDGGNLLLTVEERRGLISAYPEIECWIKRYSMGAEFIQGIDRYCFWMVGITPRELRDLPPIVKKRIEKVREMRLASKKLPTKRKAETPWLFDEIRPPEGKTYIAIPKVSSERREYIPIGFVDNGMIPGDKLFYIDNAGLYDFGIITSRFHNAWMRAVAGRLKSDYSYSNTIVYNNFIWPNPSIDQKANIEKSSQVVLRVRDKYQDCSLADLYDPLTMPSDLLKAHKSLDRAVEKAYGVNFDGDEEKIVAHLFELYSQAIKDLGCVSRTSR